MANKAHARWSLLNDPHREDVIQRLVLWNIDLTLVDVARVMRAAYAEALGAVAGRPVSTAAEGLLFMKVPASPAPFVAKMWSSTLWRVPVSTRVNPR